MNKLSNEQITQANQILGTFDNLAKGVQTRYASWGMSQEEAKRVVNALDKAADEFEASVFGQSSLQARQIEVLKQAKVILKDSDEPYMDTFNNPTKPIQTDGDEPYMAAYRDDQTQGVQTGKSSVGRPLAP
jgi:hypothetical protein